MLAKLINCSAPEILTGQAVDAKADIYSFGVSQELANYVPLRFGPLCTCQDRLVLQPLRMKLVVKPPKTSADE